MDYVLFGALTVAAWLGCGVHEVITDHLWWQRWFRETHGWQPLPIKWWTRTAKQSYLLGPIACVVGYAYRWGNEKLWKEGR